MLIPTEFPLTPETASSGVTIDADFDGEFNIEVRSLPLGPLPPE